MSVSKNIPIFKLEFDNNFIDTFKSGVEDILTSKKIIEGKYVNLFEKKFSELIDSKYAIATCNCTSALEISLKSLNIKDKIVLVPSNTFFATCISIRNAGGIIKFVDIDLDNLSICPTDLENKINDNIGAIIIVHIGGIISNKIDKIINICNKYKIPLIEDAAHAHLSKTNKYKAGTIGDIACFSFFPTKVMTTAGGGMITTNNETLYKKAKSLKDFGRNLDNIQECILENGQNSQVSEFTGLMGFLECNRVKERINKRNILLQLYKSNLQNTTYKIYEQENGLCSYYKCICLTQIDIKWLHNYCKKFNISLTGTVYNIPVHKQKAFEDLYTNELVNTDYFCNNHICPPLYPEMTEEEVIFVCDILKKAEKDFFNNYYRYSKLIAIEKFVICSKKLPNINDNELLIKLKYCGICGSDYHYYRNGGLGSFKNLPLVLGHEPCGTIIESKCEKLKINKKVIIDPSSFCNSCRYCNIKKINLCKNGTFLGTSEHDGGFAEYLKVHKSQVFLMHENMSFELACLMETLSIGVKSVQMIENINKNNSILLIGLGPIGIAIYLSLKKYGYNNILLYDKLPYRCDFIKKFGAKNIVNNSKDINQPFDICIDAVGSEETFSLCQKYLNINGTILIVGIPEKEDYLNYNPHKLRIKEATILNLRRGSDSFEKTLELFKNDEYITQMITHKYPFNNIQYAFNNASKYLNNSIKTIIEF